jgi:hypothetical protein
MPRDRTVRVGFGHATLRQRLMQRRTSALALIAVLALALSLAVAATVVSIGMARADTLAILADGDRESWAVAGLIAGFLTLLAGLAARAVRRTVLLAGRR